MCRKNLISSANLLYIVDKVVLVNPLGDITRCLLFKVVFNRYFKLCYLASIVLTFL